MPMGPWPPDIPLEQRLPEPRQGIDTGMHIDAASRAHAWHIHEHPISARSGFDGVRPHFHSAIRRAGPRSGRVAALGKMRDRAATHDCQGERPQHTSGPALRGETWWFNVHWKMQENGRGTGERLSAHNLWGKTASPTAILCTG